MTSRTESTTGRRTHGEVSVRQKMMMVQSRGLSLSLSYKVTTIQVRCINVRKKHCHSLCTCTCSNNLTRIADYLSQCSTASILPPFLSPALKASESDTFYNRSEREEKKLRPGRIYKAADLFHLSSMQMKVLTHSFTYTHTQQLIHTHTGRVMRLHAAW